MTSMSFNYFVLLQVNKTFLTLIVIVNTYIYYTNFIYSLLSPHIIKNNYCIQYFLSYTYNTVLFKKL